MGIISGRIILLAVEPPFNGGGGREVRLPLIPACSRRISGGERRGRHKSAELLGRSLSHVEYPHPELIERAVKLVTSRRLPVRYPQPTPEQATLLRSSFASSCRGIGNDRGDLQLDGCDIVLNFKFSPTTLMSGKADSHLKAKGRDQTVTSDTYWLSLRLSRFPLSFVDMSRRSQFCCHRLGKSTELNLIR